MAVTLHRIHLRKSQTLSSSTGWSWLWCEIRNRTNLLTYRRFTVVVAVVNVVGMPGTEKSAQILMTTTTLIGLVSQQQLPSVLCCGGVGDTTCG